MLEHAESVPTPPSTVSGQQPMDSDEIELEVSSTKLRLFKGRRYIALPDVRPPCLEEEEITDIIQRLEMDLKAAFGKIKAKSHRKPSRESSLIIDMRMSGELERGLTKVKLKPCIWLFCGSRWCRKIVEKDIKKLNWRLPCDIQIVDEGGPLGLLAASDDSGLDDCRTDTSQSGADFDKTSVLEDRNYNGSIEEFKYSDNTDSDSHYSSKMSAHSITASGQASETFCNARTDVYNTIHRQGPQTNPNLLPCEFSMTGCDREFHSDEDDEWIEHIIGHLRDILPRKLRCWYCFQYTFDADVTSNGSVRFNFQLRMQHIRHHILFDESPVSWARPDMSMIKHLKIHKFINDQTFRHLATQNTVFTGPGCVAVRRGSQTCSPKRSEETSTSLKLSDGMFLDFHVQESSADSSIGLTCRSTIRRENTIISERFSRMGGVITVTRGSITTLYGVTSGHGLICQILENTSIGQDDSDALSDESSQSSAYDENSISDKKSQDCTSIHDSSLTASHEKVKKWINASQGLVATFLNLRAESVDSCMVPRETSAMSDRMAGDLALIKIPTGYAKRLRNDFVDPAGPRDKLAREKGPFPAATQANDGENKVFVLMSKRRSVAGYLVAGTVHFSVLGRKIECVRIMVSEELGESMRQIRPPPLSNAHEYSSPIYVGLGSSGLWVVQGHALCGMVIAITPMDGCALILPQRRMYSDMQKIFPDASSILLGSGVAEATFPHMGSQKVSAEQVDPRSKRAMREIWDKKGKGKEMSPYRPCQWVPRFGGQEEKHLAVDNTTSASGTLRRRREQTRYYS